MLCHGVPFIWLSDMREITPDLNSEEKALLFVCLTYDRMYGPLALAGLIVAFAMMFKGSPDLSAFVTPITGWAIAYLDITVFSCFLTNVYISRSIYKRF
jgi:hypothetical protein